MISYISTDYIEGDTVHIARHRFTPEDSWCQEMEMVLSDDKILYGIVLLLLYCDNYVQDKCF